MNTNTQKILLDLNKAFYDKFAVSFADSRGNPQPGFQDLLDFLPDPCDEVMDVGCGNGRFGRFFKEQYPAVKYMGIDFSEELLKIAENEVEGSYFPRDISQPFFLKGFGRYDLIVCLAVMQHLPGRINRTAFLNELSDHLSDDGRVFLSNWQFLDSDRQKKKIIDWPTVGLGNLDVEPNDYLISWQRDGFGYRYVCLIDELEISYHADEVDLRVIKQFRHDGREGNLNLYTILSHR